MAADTVWAGVVAISGAFGTIVSGIALLRNGKSDEDKEIDRLIQRRMKLKLLEELGPDDDGPPDNIRRLDIVKRLIGLAWIHFWLRWAWWAA